MDDMFVICRVPYLAIAKTFERIEEESKRCIHLLVHFWFVAKN